MISEYLDTAKGHLKTNSDGQLSRALGLSRAYVAQLRHGIRLPSDEVMLQLAELAQKSKEAALMDLGALRASSDEVKALYINLKSKVSAAVFALFFMTALTVQAGPAEASISSPAPAYCHAQGEAPRTNIYCRHIIIGPRHHIPQLVCPRFSRYFWW